MADLVGEFPESLQVRRVVGESKQVGLGLSLVYQLGEAVGHVERGGLHAVVDPLVLNGVLKVVDIIEHSTAECDDKKVGRHHPPTGPSFDMLSHYLQNYY